MGLAMKTVAVIAVLAVGGACMPDEGAPHEDSVSQESSAEQRREPAELPTEESAEGPAPETASVPNVARSSVAEARSQLSARDLAVRVVKEPSWKPVGTVLEQGIRSGREVALGSVVTLVVASAMPKVPGTVGSTGKAALSMLRSAGFRVDVSRRTVTSGTTETVLSQSPTGAEQAEPGSTVQLVLANVVRPVAAAPAPSNCTAGYSPCLTPASDYDCAGGSGDGPEYTGYVRVTGSDPYGLDTDGDGSACET